MNPMDLAWTLHTRLAALTARLEAPALLAARLYVASVFFRAGVLKIGNWENTLFLFEEEFKVPLLPPELAAWLGTAGELGLPVLLVLGLFGQFGALGLSVVNLMAVLSVPDMAPAAFTLHLVWGVLLAALAIRGAGPWSLDAWWARRRLAAAQH